MRPVDLTRTPRGSRSAARISLRSLSLPLPAARS